MTFLEACERRGGVCDCAGRPCPLLRGGVADLLDGRLCEVCEAEPMVGVCAVPGAPMSMAYGRRCLEHGAMPMWVAQFNVGVIVPLTDVGWQHAAEWFREQMVFDNGEYRRVDTYNLVVVDCPHGPPSGGFETCPLCYENKTVQMDTREKSA